MTSKLPFYPGWLQVVLAAMAMVATLPGMHQGMGLVTEPLLKELSLDRVQFAQISLWATWIGALFCIPIGRLIDRLGVRIVLTAVAAALGVVVVGMSRATTERDIWITMILASGFGHSAMSVLSVALVGKWFVKRLTQAMGVYAVAVVVGFMIAFGVLGHGVKIHGWRITWEYLGIAIFCFAPISALLVRSAPDPKSGITDGEKEADAVTTGMDVRSALSRPVFWLFALSSAYFGMVSAGVSLFDQAILKERGFDATVYYNVLIIQTFTALIASFLGGWLGTRFSLSKQMAVAMIALAATLLLLTNLNSLALAYLYAVCMGIAGGLVTVIFFAAWSYLFGRLHLGMIQGIAQALCVITSAFGPLFLAAIHKQSASYTPALYALIPAAILLAIWALKSESMKWESV